MAQVNLGHVVGPGVPTGGTANQVLVKNGSTNFDTSWKDAGSIPSIENIQDGLAIVANGDTHAAVASGQFVYVKNHGTLAEGLYRATAAIGANATLSTSNLTADGAGGLNALKSDVDTLNSNLISTPIIKGSVSLTSTNFGFDLTGLTNYRTCYLVVASTQNGDRHFGIVFRNGDNSSISPIVGFNGATTNVSNNILTVNFNINWGTAYLIGQRA